MMRILVLAMYLLLLMSGLLHLSRMHGFINAIRQQRTLPPAIVVPVALSVAIAEVLLGALGVFLTLGGPLVLLRAVTVGAAILCGGFAAYLITLRTNERSAPCGCLGDYTTPLNGLHIVRAVLLFVVMTITAFAPTLVQDYLSGWDQATTAVAAAGTFTLLWIAPMAFGVDAGPRTPALHQDGA